MHTSLRAKAIAGLELVLPAFVLDRLAEKQVFKKDHLWPACPAFDYILAALQMYRMHGIQWRLPYNLHASFLPADGRARHCQKMYLLGVWVPSRKFCRHQIASKMWLVQKPRLLRVRRFIPLWHAKMIENVWKCCVQLGKLVSESMLVFHAII